VEEISYLWVIKFVFGVWPC